MPPRVDVPRLLDRLGIRGTTSGQWISAKCPDPDHVDKNPSWRINRDTGKHRCFSCGFHGGPIRLVAAVLDLRYKAAEEWIAGEDITAPASLEVQVDFKPVTHQFRLPQGVVVAPLPEWPAPARDYLRLRGVPLEQVARWGIGYAVDGRLAGRVVFPVRDSRGVLISYTGRSFTGARKKYLEPGIEEHADTGAVFGEEHWDDTRVVGELHHEVLVVTEGAIDALAVERITGLPVAAVYGSQLTPSHIARIARPIHVGVVIAVDSDPAGDKVATTLIDSLARWMPVVRWIPPVGEDCASLALKDPDALKAGIQVGRSVVMGARS